jgi:hypothetical protein
VRILPYPVAVVAALVAAAVLTGCGDDEEQPDPKRLARQATRELKQVGVWDRWAVESVKAVSGNAVFVLTGLDPDAADAQPAATVICTTLRNPAFTDIEVDLVAVLLSTGNAIMPPACEP